MTPPDTSRIPRNWLERWLWLHGRKYAIAVFAGVSAFAIALVGMWIVARTNPETGRIVEQIVSGYLWTSAGMVGVYSGSNAVIERAHAHQGTTTTTSTSTTSAPRQSGTVKEPDA